MKTEELIAIAGDSQRSSLERREAAEILIHRGGKDIVIKIAFTADSEAIRQDALEALKRLRIEIPR